MKSPNILSWVNSLFMPIVEPTSGRTLAKWRFHLAFFLLCFSFPLQMTNFFAIMIIKLSGQAIIFLLEMYWEKWMNWKDVPLSIRLIFPQRPNHPLVQLHQVSWQLPHQLRPQLLQHYQRENPNWPRKKWKRFVKWFSETYLKCLWITWWSLGNSILL